MKHTLTLALLLVLALSVNAQQMRDSSVTKPVLTKNLMITVNYGGVADQYLVPAEDVAAWIAARGVATADTTRPINRAILGHIIAEIERHKTAWQQAKQYELGLLDPDVMTLTAMRQAAAAIRLKYRQYPYNYTISVPVVAQ